MPSWVAKAVAAGLGRVALCVVAARLLGWGFGACTRVSCLCAHVALHTWAQDVGRGEIWFHSALRRKLDRMVGPLAVGWAVEPVCQNSNAGTGFPGRRGRLRPWAFWKRRAGSQGRVYTHGLCSLDPNLGSFICTIMSDPAGWGDLPLLSSRDPEAGGCLDWPELCGHFAPQRGPRATPTLPVLGLD